MLVPLSPILLIKQRPFPYKTPPAMSITVVSREIRISNTLGHRKVLTAVWLLMETLIHAMTLLCGIPSSDFRGMPHHMQYSARGLGTAMSPEFFVTKIMLLILPDWKVRQIRKITVPIKQIIRWLLLTNLTGKPGISDLRLWIWKTQNSQLHVTQLLRVILSHRIQRWNWGRRSGVHWYVWWHQYHR